jgi:hypothetical protein
MAGAGVKTLLGLAAGALLALLPVEPASADPIAPASLVPALTIYVDSLARGHAAAPACAPDNSPARDAAGWTQAKHVFIATLWANGYPADFITDVAARLDSSPAGKPDCADPALGADLAAAAADGWPKEVHRVLGALDLHIVEKPVPADRWAMIKGIIAGELPAQANEFACLAALEPGVLPVVLHGWDEMIVKLAGTLVAAGIPHPEVIAALGGAEANILWKPASADALPALRKACTDDTSWSDRLASLRDIGLGGGIEHMLAGEGP